MTAPTRRVARALMLSAMLLAASSSTARAQRDKYIPLVLQLPADARGLSMGGASVALGGIDAVFHNPSFVGQSTQSALSLGRWSSAATDGAFAAGTKYGRFGVGVGVHLLDYSRDAGVAPVSSNALTQRGSLPASSLFATLALRTTWKDINWGGAVKYVEERGALVKDGGVAFDLGASKDLPFANLTAGVAVQNIGQSLSMLGQHFALPQRFALGVQGGNYNIGKWIDLGVVAQVAARRDGQVYPSAGGEITYEPLEGFEFTARAGVRRPELDVQRPLTLGGAFTFDRFTIDYAWEQLQTHGAHRVTLRMR